MICAKSETWSDVRRGIAAGVQRRSRGGLMAALMLVCAAADLASAAEPASGRHQAQRPASSAGPRSHKVDHAVTPAGGVQAAQGNCWQCRQAACPQCRLAEEHHNGHGPCQHGLCPAHCPVRPDVFGFYGTQWRRWPGSGVVQASSLEAATPARPPRSAVPGATEESSAPLPGAEPLPMPAKPRDGGEKRPADAKTEPPAIQPPGGPPKEGAQPAEKTGNEKPVPATPVESEDLFNFDDVPRSIPWRSFTAAAVK